MFCYNKTLVEFDLVQHQISFTGSSDARLSFSSPGITCPAKTNLMLDSVSSNNVKYSHFYFCFKQDALCTELNLVAPSFTPLYDNGSPFLLENYSLDSTLISGTTYIPVMKYFLSSLLRDIPKKARAGDSHLDLSKYKIPISKLTVSLYLINDIAFCLNLVSSL